MALAASPSTLQYNAARFVNTHDVEFWNKTSLLNTIHYRYSSARFNTIFATHTHTHTHTHTQLQQTVNKGVTTITQNKADKILLLKQFTAW